jgi:transcriptional regulator with XRE-family HTH domain
MSDMTTKDKIELLISIGNRIKSLREQKGISQQDLAALCNFEKANMRRIEAGRTNPTIYTLHKISQALGVSLSELVEINNLAG